MFLPLSRIIISLLTTQVRMYSSFQYVSNDAQVTSKLRTVTNE